MYVVFMFTKIHRRTQRFVLGRAQLFWKKAELNTFDEHHDENIYWKNLRFFSILWQIQAWYPPLRCATAKIHSFLSKFLLCQREFIKISIVKSVFFCDKQLITIKWGRSIFWTNKRKFRLKWNVTNKKKTFYHIFAMSI